MHQKYYSFLKILDCAIQNKKETLPENFNIAEGYEIAKKHRLTTMYFYGLLNCGVKKDNKIVNSLFVDVCADTLIDERQKYEISRIESTFCAYNVDYMLLKGAVLKGLYYKSEMRPMSDIDILIKIDQYSSVRTAMLELGYEEGYESNHELIWNNENGVVELHKYLIPSYNNDYFSYYNDGWDFACNHDKNRYYMSKEDEYIYIFTHFAKHYRDRGVGLKPVIDLRVYLLKYPDLNQEYIYEELKKLKLNEFYKNIIDTISVWFNEKPSNEITDHIANKIFDCNIYGTRKNYILSKALREQINNKSLFSLRLKRIFRSIFVPYTVMSKRFICVKKCPILLPFMWVYYVLERLLCKGKFRTLKKDVSLLNKNYVEQYQNELNLVGLDFNYEE